MTRYMIRIVQNPVNRQYLERDTYGGPMRWTKLTYATRFTKSSATLILNTLVAQGERRAIIVNADTGGGVR